MLLTEILGSDDAVSFGLMVIIVGAVLAVRGWFHGLDKRLTIVETKMSMSGKSGVWREAPSDHE